MHMIMHIVNALPLSEKRLFKEESKCDCKMTQLLVLEILLLFPCFMIKNAYNYGSSSLCSLFSCQKDVFYRFLSNEFMTGATCSAQSAVSFGTRFNGRALVQKAIPYA